MLRWIWEKERRTVATLCAATLATRLLAAFTTAVIAMDGARFGRMAREFSTGDLAAGLAVDRFPPLYPLATAAVHSLGLPLLAAAIAVSVAASVGTQAALYLLAREVWNRRVATIAGAIFALTPSFAILGGDVMSESLFFFVFVGSMALAWTGLERGRPGRAALAGVFAAAAYLSRPEGVYTIPLMLLAFGLHAWRHRADRPRVLRGLAGTAAGLLLAVAAAVPYLAYVRRETGRWGLTPNPYANQIVAWLRGEPVDPDGPYRAAEHRRMVERFGRPAGAAVAMGDAAARVAFYAPLAFLIAGWACARRELTSGAGAVFVHAACVGYLIPPYLSFFAGTPFGDRYIMVPFLLWMPATAVGIAATWDARRRALRAATFTLLALTAVAMLGATAWPRRRDKVAIREAGEYIRGEAGPGMRVAAQDRRVEFYSEGIFVPIEGGRGEELFELMDPSRVDFIVVRRGGRRDPGEVGLEALRRRYPPVRVFDEETDTPTFVFRIAPTPGPAPSP